MLSTVLASVSSCCWYLHCFRLGPASSNFLCQRLLTVSGFTSDFSPAVPNLESPWHACDCPIGTAKVGLAKGVRNSDLEVSLQYCSCRREDILQHLKSCGLRVPSVLQPPAGSEHLTCWQVIQVRQQMEELALPCWSIEPRKVGMQRWGFMHAEPVRCHPGLL